MAADLIQTIGETRDPETGLTARELLGQGRFPIDFVANPANRKVTEAFADRMIAAIAERVAGVADHALTQARAERDEARRQTFAEAALIADRSYGREQWKIGEAIRARADGLTTADAHEIFHDLPSTEKDWP